MLLKNRLVITTAIISCALSISIMYAGASDVTYGQSPAYNQQNTYTYSQPQMNQNYGQPYYNDPYGQYGYNQQQANIYYQNTYPTAGANGNGYNPYYTQQYNSSRTNDYTSSYPQPYSKDNKTNTAYQANNYQNTTQTYNTQAASYPMQNNSYGTQTTGYNTQDQTYNQTKQQSYGTQTSNTQNVSPQNYGNYGSMQSGNGQINSQQTTNYNRPYSTYPQNNNQYNPQNVYINNATVPPITSRIETNQKIPLYQNQSTVELHDMINKIGDRIVQKNGITTKVQFKLNNEAVQNAYTEFSGKITIYKGLIEYCEDSDELAFVIGHELGHAVSKHVLKATAVNAGVNLGKEVFKGKVLSKIDNVWGRMAADTATDVAADAITNKYIRMQENDADKLSIDFVVAAGYNPLAGISIMNKIGENYADFWSDHPSTDKRIVTMYNYIKEKYPAYLDIQYDSYSYKQAVATYIK